jgi:hypothetical protein
MPRLRAVRICGEATYLMEATLAHVVKEDG